ncbi:MAG: methionyl-tRNA formyltransferase [Spirochaetaceae bacterium]|nr:methionyl-tRNA formyltransferase [Spirochaetaceae bacterium]
MKLLFAGTPEIAVPSLKTLYALHVEGGFCELSGVLTNPDTAKGRRGSASPSDVGVAAEEMLRCVAGRGGGDFVLIKSAYPDENCFQKIARLGADMLVSFAYGAIFPPDFLALFPMGGINIHPSLLPKYRGASPIPAAILNRERETGISVQRIAAKLDSGNILAQEVIPLTGRETSAVLSGLVAEKSAALLERTLRALAVGAGSVVETPQNHSAATFCGKLGREDGCIDWRQSALFIDAQVRAFNPYPLAYTRHDGLGLYILEAAPYESRNAQEVDFASASAGHGAGAVLGVDKSAGIIVQTGDGLLVLKRLQYQTRKPLDWRSFLNGAKNFTGAVLG